MYGFKIQCNNTQKKNDKILITYPQQHYYCCGGSSLNRTANCIRIYRRTLSLLYHFPYRLLFVSGEYALYSNILVVYIPETHSTMLCFAFICNLLFMYNKTWCGKIYKTQLHSSRQPIVFMYYVD